MDLNNETELRIANAVDGTCLSPWEIIRQLGLEGQVQEWEVVKAANNHDQYCCYVCGWWNDVGDIYSVEICTDCHDDERG